MVTHSMSSQRFNQLWDLPLRLTSRQLRDLLGAGLTTEQCQQHALSGDAEHITEYVPDLDVDLLKAASAPGSVRGLHPVSVATGDDSDRAAHVPASAEYNLNGCGRGATALPSARHLSGPSCALCGLYLFRIGQHDQNDLPEC